MAMKSPIRIVSLAPSHTEILFALGLGEQVVGVTANCDYPPEAAGKTRVGLFAEPDLARIISLQPSLVVASANLRLDDSRREELQKAGILVRDFLPRTVAELLQGMEEIAGLAGAGAAGRNLVASLRERTARLQEKMSRSGRPRVFFLMTEDPLTTPGPASCQYDALFLAGAGLLPARQEVSFLYLSWDEVVEYDPEIVIACGTAPGRAPRKRCPGCRLANPPCAREVSGLLSHPRLAGVTAVKKGRVFPVPCTWLCRPGPRLIDGIEKLSTLFSLP